MSNATNDSAQRSEQATVRLSVSVSIELHGESPERARALLVRQVELAILQGLAPQVTAARLVDHSFDKVTLYVEDLSRRGDTDFSQLLG